MSTPTPHRWVSLVVAHCRHCDEQAEGGDPSCEGPLLPVEQGLSQNF